MKSIWQQFSPRERLMVIFGVFVIFLGVSYEFIWLPIQNKNSTLLATVQNKEQALQIMQHLSPQNLTQSPGMHHKTTSVTTEQLLNTVQESLNQMNLNLFVKEIRQEQRNQVSIQFDAVGFDNLLNWLVQIWQTYHIKVQTINITPTQNSGEVKASLIIGL